MAPPEMWPLNRRARRLAATTRMVRPRHEGAWAHDGDLAVTRRLADMPVGYGDWVAGLKTRIRETRLRVSMSVNAELIGLYWRIGRDILERQQQHGWGARVVDRLAVDLRAEFKGMRGFSRANLLYMRAFAEAWPDPDIVQRVVGQF